MTSRKRRLVVDEQEMLDGAFGHLKERRHFDTDRRRPQRARDRCTADGSLKVVRKARR